MLAADLGPIANATLLEGSPLHVALDGENSEGGGLTYTVTTDNALVEATVFQFSDQGNRSLRLNVEKRESIDGALNVTDLGEMVFQLFEDRAGRATNQIIQLTDAGYYNGILFHRVIDDFVIQAGSSAISGTTASTLGRYDDQFHVDLQHNTTGLLSSAKLGDQAFNINGFPNGDDTNTTEFFVTEGSSRHLDFNHTVFGMLTEGEDVREAISETTVSGTTSPTSVVITSAEIFDDTENAVLMLKTLEGATGTVTVTVTARDAAGNESTQQFQVTVSPDAVDNHPFLNDIPTIHTTVNTPITVPTGFQDVDGGDHRFLDETTLPGVTTVIGSNAQGPIFGPAGVPVTSSDDISYSVDPVTGEITVTPGTDVRGVFEITVAVATVESVATQSGPVDYTEALDYQVIQVVVAEAAPGAIDLASSSESGNSDSDNVTNAGTGVLEFTVDGVVDGALVKLYAGDLFLAEQTATGTSVTISVDPAAVADGVLDITATQTVNDAESQRSAALQLTLDRSVNAFAATPPQAHLGVPYIYTASNPDDLTAIQYALQSGAPAGMSINSNTGLITWTPTAEQLGLQTFTILATDDAGNTLEQSASIQVAPGPPTSIDLLSTSDSGNTTDNVTNDTTPDFLVGGITGATIKIYATNSSGVTEQIGEGTVDDVTGIVTANLNPSFLVDGTYQISATQGFDGAESLPTPLGTQLTMIIDTTGPAFTSTPASTPAFVGLQFSYDAQTGDETAQQLVGYSLLNSPAGMTISSAGIVRWTPLGADEGSHTFQIVATDAQGNETTQDVTLNVVYEPIARVRVQFTDLSGNVIDSVNVDEQFLVQVLVSDLRDEESSNLGPGVFTAFVDLAFNSALVQGTLGAIADHGVYTALAGGTVTTALIDDAGGTQDGFGFGGDSPGPLGTGEFLLFSVPFTAINAPGFDAVDDVQNIDENATDMVLDVLANDSVNLANFTFGNNSVNVTIFDPVWVLPTPDGSSSPLVDVVNGTLRIEGDVSPTVSDVGQAAHGTVTIGANGANLIYTPDAGFIGTDTFTYTIDDGAGGTAQATISVVVSDVNDPPDVQDDTFAAIEDSDDNVINVLENDTTAPDSGETLTITSVGGTNHGGTVSIDENAPDNKILYTPADDFFGTETFTYTVTDSRGATNTATVTVSVSNTNDPPSANGDVVQVAEDSANNTLNVLTNDSISPDSDETITITGIGVVPSHGTVTINDDSMTLSYTPNAEYVGTDTFSYLIDDGYGGTSSALVKVHVGNILAPLALPDEYTFIEDSTNNSLDLLSNDVLGADDLPIHISTVGEGSHGGVLSISADKQSVLYTPALNFFGQETFTYTIKDTADETGIGTVTVNVSAVDDPPEARNDIFNVIEDSPASVLQVLSNDANPDSGETLTITGAGGGNQGGTIAISPNLREIRYTPAANFFGQETFTYSITDGNGNSDTATVRVDVQAVNDDAPTAVNDAFTTTKNTTSNFINVLLNDSIAPDINETLLVDSVGGGSASGTLSVAPNGIGVIYTPAADFVGTETFQYTLRDSNGETATATVTVTVRDFLPSDVTGSVYIDTNTNGLFDPGDFGIGGVLITLTGTDDFGVPVSLTTHTNAAGGYRFDDLAPGTYVVQESQPAFLMDRAESVGLGASVIGNDAIRIQLGENVLSAGNNFGEGRLETQYVSQNMFYARTPRSNTRIVVGPDGTGWYLAPGSAFGSPPVASLSADGQSLTVSVGDASGTFDIGAAGHFYEIASAGPLRLFTVMTSLDQLPLPVGAVSDSGAAAEDQTITLNVLANDRLNGAAAVTGVSQGANGAVSFQANGSVTYTPNADFHGVDSFAYTLVSGGVTSTAQVSVTISSVIDISNDSETTDEDSPLSIDVLANDTFEGTASVTAVGTATNGTAVLETDGTITYTPNADFHGSDSFTYSASSAGLVETATVSVTVAPVDDIVDDTATYLQDSPVNVDVLANDSFEGTPVVTVGNATDGTVTVESNGTITYTPDSGFSGTDTFDYTVTSGGTTETATVSVMLNAVSFAPVPEGEPSADLIDAIFAEDEEGEPTPAEIDAALEDLSLVM